MRLCCFNPIRVLAMSDAKLSSISWRFLNFAHEFNKREFERPAIKFILTPLFTSVVHLVQPRLSPFTFPSARSPRILAFDATDGSFLAKLVLGRTPYGIVAMSISRPGFCINISTSCDARAQFQEATKKPYNSPKSRIQDETSYCGGSSTERRNDIDRGAKLLQ